VGTFHVAIELGSLDGSRWEFVEALVDTGASHSIFPASLLRQLGIEPTERWPFRLADERQREFDVGQARLRVQGREGYSMVVFGNDGIEARVGRLTLTELGLAPNHSESALIAAPGMLLSPRQAGPD